VLKYLINIQLFFAQREEIWA